MRRRVSTQERRARLAVRHRLAPSARTDDDLVAVARSVVVLHATDPSSVVLAAMARMRTPDPAAVEGALYDERCLVRMLAMRRTMFTCAAEDAALLQRSSSDAVAAAERKKLLTVVERMGIAPDPEAWLRAAEEVAEKALGQLGEATTAELSQAVPSLRQQLIVNPGTKWPGRVGVGSRVLFLLAAQGRIVRGRPKGSWNSSTHRWVSVQDWLGGPLASFPAGDARTELARRWLARFGPATVADLKWWTGWTMGHTREALTGVDVEIVDLDGVEGLALRGDLERTAPSEPWIALLPGLDPTTMGWQQRDWYLGAHKAQVFDTNGNAGPTVWADGRIVGGWAQRASGEVVFRLLEDIGAERTAEVEAAAARLPRLLGKTRVVPRFPTPLDRELSA